MDLPEKLVWTVREESQDLMEQPETQVSEDQTDHQEPSEKPEDLEPKDQPDHEDHQELTESSDLRDHPDPEEPQDQLWSSTCHLDQNPWHQRDHHGDQLRTKKKKPRNKWICSISLMDLRLPCSERPSLMEVQNIQLNHAEKFKCASPKPRQETTGWTPTEVHLRMLLL